MEVANKITESWNDVKASATNDTFKNTWLDCICTLWTFH